MRDRAAPPHPGIYRVPPRGGGVFPPPIPYEFFLFPLFHQCDSCLEWGLMAGLWGFTTHGGSILSKEAGWPHWKPWVSQAPTFHLSEVIGYLFFFKPHFFTYWVVSHYSYCCPFTVSQGVVINIFLFRARRHFRVVYLP